jgi:hypothetical protein
MGDKQSEEHTFLAANETKQQAHRKPTFLFFPWGRVVLDSLERNVPNVFPPSSAFILLLE